MKLQKKKFKEFASQVDVLDFSELATYFSNLYQLLKNKTPKYTYVDFSENLGLGACNASLLIIRGWRRISVKKAKEIARSIGLTNESRKYFLQLVEHSRSSVKDENNQVSKLLEIRQEDLAPKDKIYTEFFANWYNAAILELLHQDLPDGSPKAISRLFQFKVSESEVEHALRVLLSLQLIYWDGKLKAYKPSQLSLSTNPEVYEVSVLAFHEQMMALAQQALIQVASEKREFGALTITVPEEKVDELKERLYQFRESLMDFANENPGGKKVVQINTQMFPITKDKKN